MNNMDKKSSPIFKKQASQPKNSMFLNITIHGMLEQSIF